jgi:hypothetical protein
VASAGSFVIVQVKSWAKGLMGLPPGFASGRLKIGVTGRGAAFDMVT